VNFEGGTRSRYSGRDHAAAGRRRCIMGMRVVAKDQRTPDEVGALIKAHQAAGERFAEAQREGRRIVNGD